MQLCRKIAETHAYLRHNRDPEQQSKERLKMEQNTFAEAQSPSSENNTSTGSSTPEKTFVQSEVNEMIRHSNARVAEKARREALEGIQSVQPNQTSQVSPTNTVASNTVTPEHLERMVSETVEKKQKELLETHNRQTQEQQAYQVANDFVSKMQAGKTNYDDFDSVVSDLDFSTMGPIVHSIKDMDNVADVIYDLAQNPMKLGSLNNLLATQPAKARAEIKKLSDSIKSNQAAKQQKQANEPLSRVQPSPIGTDNGSKSVSDYRKIFAGRR